jgi:uncharacterized protein
MDVHFTLHGLEFEWDAEKARMNVEKHGVTFVEAAEAFRDPYGLHGEASTNDEDRVFVIGMTESTRTLFVVHAERADTTRIISARPATRAERRAYERNR